jgi:hypothetical protein
MSLDNAWDRFFKAMHGSVTCTQTSLQNRLACVYTYDLIHVTNEDGGIPPAIWGRIEDIRKAMTVSPGKTDDETIRQATSRMSDTEAAAWLHEMVEIFNELARVRYNVKPRLYQPAGR